MPKKYDDESFNKIVKDKYGDLFEFLETYQNSRVKIKTKCKFGHEFLGDPKKFTKEDGYKGCPICNAGETKEQYEANPNYCKECGRKIIFSNSVAETRKKQFCDHSCSAIYSNKNRVVEKEKNLCITCGAELKPSSLKYCSKKCQNKYNTNKYVEKWKNGIEDGLKGEYSISNYIKNYLFEKYENKCSQCGWSEINPFTGKIPLEVEHIDGNYQNNSEDNLTLLCPNCHSLTATYKGANMGNGRKERTKYYIKKSE